MDTGVLALVGIFALAGACAVWNWRRRRSIDRQGIALGFESCESEAPALLHAWRALSTSRSAARERELVVGHCLRRAAGWGMVHRFQVNEGVVETSHREPVVGAHYDAYLLDLRDPDTVFRRPVTLFVLPPGSALLRAMIRRTIEIDPPGRSLEIGAHHPWASTIVAAYGETDGKLDDCVPAAVQERIARAAGHGFFTVHLGGGKAGFAVLPGHRDVASEWLHLSEWV